MNNQHPGYTKTSFKQAKRLYTDRFTMEHAPDWAAAPIGENYYYAPQYRTDREWFDNSVFPGEYGFPSGTTHYQSFNPSWPLGKRLEEPYRVNAPTGRGGKA